MLPLASDVITPLTILSFQKITLDVNNEMRYCTNMIKSFRDKETEKIFNRYFSGKLPENIQNNARKKLVMLDSVTEIEDLRVPPGNRLEALKGDRKGQHSIRINDQWRICFKWKDGNSYDVEIADYH